MSRILLLAAAVIGTGLAPAGDDKDILKDPEIVQALSVLNAARKQAGLDEVTLSPTLSKGCHAHARYLILNRGDPKVAGLKAHEEHESLKGYTPEGAKAAKASVIHFILPSRAVSDWLASFYHRIPLLLPNLTEVGIGYDKDKQGAVALIDCISGLKFKKPARPVVYFPEDGQTGVALRFQAELPTPLPESHKGAAGYPITITFAAQQKVTAVEFTLKDGGKAVAVYLSTPEKPASSWIQWNTVCAIPERPLAAATEFTAELRCRVDGKDFSRAWKFSTVK